jgi:hypothetical protein
MQRRTKRKVYGAVDGAANGVVDGAANGAEDGAANGAEAEG